MVMVLLLVVVATVDIIVMILSTCVHYRFNVGPGPPERSLYVTCLKKSSSILTGYCVVYWIYPNCVRRSHNHIPKIYDIIICCCFTFQ